MAKFYPRSSEVNSNSLALESTRITPNKDVMKVYLYVMFGDVHNLPNHPIVCKVNKAIPSLLPSFLVSQSTSSKKEIVKNKHFTHTN